MTEGQNDFMEKLVVKDSKDGSSALTAVQHKQTEKLSEGE
jgi:hypothetical protein